MGGAGQASSEFLTTYGFAIIIVALVIALIYTFTSMAQSSVPTSCTFTFGAYCNDLVLASNSLGSHAIFLFTNTQQYALVNPQMTINSTGTGTASGTCEPKFAPAGSAIICNVTISGKTINTGSTVSGQVRLTGITCPSGNAAACASQPTQTFTGTFSTHSTSLIASNPVSITLNAQNTTQLSEGSFDQLTAKVLMLGYPLTGASVNFTSNSISAAISPSISASNSNGDSYSYVSSYNASGPVKITASFAGHNASTVITFNRAIYLTFQTSGIPTGTSGTVLLFGGKSFAQNQIPTRMAIGAGTQQSYTFTNPISAGTGTRYAFASISGCGFTSSSQSFTATSSCTATANYTTQYLLTTAASPSAGGSVSPTTEWVNYAYLVTISQSPAAGYAFSDWVGTGAGSYSGTDPTLYGALGNPISETAYFTSTSTSTLSTSTSTSSSTSTSTTTSSTSTDATTISSTTST